MKKKTRYYVTAEVNCEVTVAVDASSEAEAHRAAEASLFKHLEESCSGLQSFCVDESDAIASEALVIDLDGEAIGYLEVA